MPIEQWIRLAIFALVIFSFVRRFVKARSQSSKTQRGTSIRPARPVAGRKNDFRDVPPPPENPELG